MLLCHHGREPLGSAKHSYKYRPNLLFTVIQTLSQNDTVLDSVQNITKVYWFKVLHIEAIMQQQILNTRGLQAMYALSVYLSSLQKCLLLDSNNTAFLLVSAKGCPLPLLCNTFKSLQDCQVVVAYAFRHRHLSSKPGLQKEF